MKSVAKTLSAMALSLLIWAFFYEEGMPLTASETALVAGLSLAAVVFASWAWGRIYKNDGQQSKVTRRNPTTRKLTKTTKLLVAGFIVSFLSSGARDRQAFAVSNRQAENASPQLESPVVLACSPDRPVTRQDRTVVLRAWAAPQAGTLRYTWVVSMGMLTGGGHEVEWNLKGAAPGIYRAEVKLNGFTTPGATCSVRVVVLQVEPERGSSLLLRETGRAFLVRGKTEADGYGLYSYFLLGSYPTEETKPRFLKALQTYSSLIGQVGQLEGYISREKLNITYLPVETSVDVGLVDAAWLLQHYDYARARVLLDGLPGGRKDGIYLVSCSKPLSNGGGSPYLLQDLSTVPTEPGDLISWWIREFLNQASQQQFWEPRTTKLLALKLRTTIAVLATGLPEVQHSLDTWIAWLH